MILLPEPFACPSCHRSDKAEKVSHVVNAGQSTSTYAVQPLSVTIAGSTSTDLVKLLALPTEPSYSSSRQSGWVYLVLAGELLPLIAIELVIIVKDRACLAHSSVTRCGTGGDIVLSYILFYVTVACMLLTLSLRMCALHCERRKASAQIRQVLKQAKETWKDLYYCSRDGGVFLPYAQPDLIPAVKTIPWLFRHAPDEVRQKLGVADYIV